MTYPAKAKVANPATVEIVVNAFFIRLLFELNQNYDEVPTKKEALDSTAGELKGCLRAVISKDSFRSSFSFLSQRHRALIAIGISYWP